MRFGEWLRETREAAGLTAYRLAQLSGLSRSFLSDLETGRTRSGKTVLPGDDALEKLAPVLGVPVEDLKREALRDRLDHQELEAAAEIIAEEATPEQWVRIHQRAKKRTPEEERKFWEAMQVLAAAELKLQQKGRGVE